MTTAELEQELLAKVAAAPTRDEVVPLYRSALLDNNLDWGQVNRAIAQRWSIAAIKYIKKQAWKGLI